MGKLLFYRDKVRGLEHEFEPLAIDTWIEDQLQSVAAAGCVGGLLEGCSAETV